MPSEKLNHACMLTLALDEAVRELQREYGMHITDWETEHCEERGAIVDISVEIRADEDSPSFRVYGGMREADEQLRYSMYQLNDKSEGTFLWELQPNIEQGARFVDVKAYWTDRIRIMMGAELYT